MIWDLLATAAAAFGAAGVALFLTRVLKLRLPRWTVPVAAGGAMLSYSVWAEYAWYPRLAAALPPTAEIVLTRERSDWWRPWTFAVPITAGFVAVDRGSMRTHAAAPGQRMVPLVVVSRWTPPARVPVLFDCAGGRIADLAQGAEFGPDGLVADTAWRPADPADPMFTAACREA